MNALKAKEQNGRKYSERLIEAKPDENYINNDSNDGAVPTEKESNQIQGIQNYLGISVINFPKIQVWSLKFFVIRESLF